MSSIFIEFLDKPMNIIHFLPASELVSDEVGLSESSPGGEQFGPTHWVCGCLIYGSTSSPS
jgi:hypothetical protein